MDKFRVREYELLKQEVLAYVSESRQIEKAAVGAAAAVYAWLATHSGLPKQLWLVPPAFAILGFIRAIAIGAHIDTIAGYLRQLETQLAPDEKGWDTFLHEKRRSEGRRVVESAAIFWLVFIALSVALSLSLAA